jgi:anti-anti-sigma factor
MPGPLPPGFMATPGGGGTVIVLLSGELDIGNRCWLARRLAEIVEQQPRRLVFDMAEVGFADCASVRLIVGTARSLPDRSRPVISRPGPVVRRVLQVTGLDTRCDLT